MVFSVKAVLQHEKEWYQTHTESRYLLNVPIEHENLGWEFPRIIGYIQKLHIEIIFANPLKCNLSMVQEFYANLQADAQTQFVEVQGVQVNMSPMAINNIYLGLLTCYLAS